MPIAKQALFKFLDGKVMKKEECMLIGEILRKANVDLAIYGVELKQLTEGNNSFTYEEMQYVLQYNPTTHRFAVNLKEELSTSKPLVNV